MKDPGKEILAYCKKPTESKRRDIAFARYGATTEGGMVKEGSVRLPVEEERPFGESKWLKKKRAWRN